MGWSAAWQDREHIDPLDGALWADLLRACAERRAACGLESSARLQGQPPRFPAAFRRVRRISISATGRVTRIWKELFVALWDDIREMSAMYYHRETLAANAEITEYGENPDMATPISPIPPTMADHLPILFDLARAMPPTSDAARLAMLAAHDALDSMQLLILAPVALSAGWVLRSPGEWSRILPSAAMVTNAGVKSRPSGDSGIHGETIVQTNWAWQASGEPYLDTFDIFKLDRAAAYTVQCRAECRCDVLAQSSVGGTVRAWVRGEWPRAAAPGDPYAVDTTTTIDQRGAQARMSIATAARLLLGHDSSDTLGGPGQPFVVGGAPGWSDLGQLVPDTVATLLPDPSPFALPDTQGAADTRAQATAGWPTNPDFEGDTLRTMHRVGWSILCACLDCEFEYIEPPPDNGENSEEGTA